MKAMASVEKFTNQFTITNTEYLLAQKKGDKEEEVKKYEELIKLMEKGKKLNTETIPFIERALIDNPAMLEAATKFPSLAGMLARIKNESVIK